MQCEKAIMPLRREFLSSSSGEVPTTSRKWAPTPSPSSRRWTEASRCARLLVGGMVAQEITLQAPDLVRKLNLMGTVRGGQGMASLTQVAKRIFGPA